MKTYELKLIKGGRGVFKISVVKDGAVEGGIVKFSEEHPEKEILVFNNEEKQIFYSIVMRPNKYIFRKDINGEPARTFYTKETVEEAAVNYWRNHGNTETNINHSEDVNVQGIFPFESWLVQDPETDKSKSIGLQTFAGDWVAGYKVDSKEIWDDYIKTGKLDGLSIEAMHHKYELIPDLKMEKQKEKKEDKKSFWDELLEFVNMKKEQHSKDEPAPAEPAEKKVEKHVDEKTPEEIAAEAEAKAKEADDAAAADAEKAAAEPAEPAEPPTPAEPTEQEQIYLDKIAALEKEIADLKAKQIETDTALETMKKQTPAAKKISGLPPAEKAIPYEEMTRFQKLKFNRENSRY
jgi:flagellar biosynthesis GTPase FlhF